MKSKADTESSMLKLVRKWRKSAYKAAMARSPEEAAKHHAMLLKKFGLEEPSQPRKVSRKKPAA